MLEWVMTKPKPTLKQIPIDLLIRGKYQPREHFDKEKLQELAESIKSTGGLLQPIVTRSLANGKYEIIAGERRFRAAQLAHLTEVSCLVGIYSDEQALQASIIENISRADLNPIEEAKSFQRLIDEFHYLHEEIAASVGRSRTAITNSLRLLKLDPKVKELLITGEISEGHGKILASLTSEQQRLLAEQCVKKNWNVRKLELEAKRMQLASECQNETYSDANLKRLEIALSEHVGNRVSIEYEPRGGGSMRIRFNNIDELEGHFDRIGFNQNED
jgi:ParB family chromosome partitioning protein